MIHLLWYMLLIFACYYIDSTQLLLLISLFFNTTVFQCALQTRGLDFNERPCHLVIEVKWRTTNIEVERREVRLDTYLS